ncbi:MAG TPA: NAD(P)H-dependent glycerol-3-phosphate dehydrogenase [Candidatus Methylomirabilis sp.]|nr:NAD(P)H-dependent glycerol-3-phosphate dehydrogenase [Candidatus Methylomirabilis sp.]
MTGNAATPFESVAVIGAGAWGTTLAAVLAGRYPRVALWVFEAELAEEMARTRQNAVYLPDVRLPESVSPTASLETALSGQPLVILVVPSHAFRGILEKGRDHLDPGALVVSATKGIEVGTLSTMGQIMRELLPRHHHPTLAVLSGPGFAREVAARRPTAIVAAAGDAAVAHAVQHAVSGVSLRVYAGTDPLGVELGGAVKNVIAIAAGVVDGLGLGLNARAALITRGLAEMTRLGVAMGAEARTFAGLAGMGDLILTCTGDLSRNRRVGLELAKGATLANIQAASRAVAEGINTCRSTVSLAEKHGVEMPICRAVHRVLFEGQGPREAVVELMTRELRFEGE